MHDEAQNCHGRLELAARSILSPAEGGRRENQDNYLIIDGNGNARFLWDQQETLKRLEDWPSGHLRLAVLDGLGGHSRGRQAVENTVAGLLKIPATAAIKPLSQQLESLHSQLHQEMHVGGEEPGCTLTMLEIPPSELALLFHVGDSRFYVIDAAAATCLTVDHVPATKYVLHGGLDEAGWNRYVHELPGYQICQAFILGNDLRKPSDELDVGLFELHNGNLPPFLQNRGDRRALSLEPNRLYLLASDGFWHLSKPQNFIRRWPQILFHPEQSLQDLLDNLFAELRAETRKESQPHGDNSTAIALRVVAA